MAENFSWSSALDVGLGAAQGLLKWYGSKNSTIVAEGARKARNTVAASKNSLAATVRTINNQRIMEAAGKAFEAESLNLQRQRGAAAGQRFDQSIRNQENSGARAAQIAASGVGGIAMAAVAGATELMQARMLQQSIEREGQVTYNTAARMSGIIADASASQDRSVIGGNVDSTTATDTGGSVLSLFTSLAAGALGKKDSLQVMLGSLEPAPGATTSPVTQATASPYELPQVISTPVRTQTVTGFDLPPLVSSPTTKTLGGV